MINLIKNELYKLFHKPSVYILMLLIVIFNFIGIFGYKLLVTDDSTSATINQMNISTYETLLSTLDPANSADVGTYVEYKVTYELLKFENDHSFKSTSSEYYYIENNIKSDLTKLYTAQYINKDDEGVKEAQAQYDKDVDFLLNNYDWKVLVNNEITKDNSMIKLLDESTDSTQIETIKMDIVSLQYRLDNNVPFSQTDASTDLSGYSSAYSTYSSYSTDEKTFATRDQLIQKRTAEKNYKLLKYRIDNKLITNDESYGNSYSSLNMFKGAFTSISFIIVLCVIIISSSILTEEFNKGTIKQLFIRPYTRSKILTSKVLAIFITVLLFILVNALSGVIISAIVNGSIKTLADPILVYSFISHEVIKMNVLSYSLLTFLTLLPEYLMLTFVTLLVGALTTNGASSIVGGIGLYIVSSIFEAYASIKWVSFVPTMNWNLSGFLFGGISEYQYVTLGKSIVIDVITIAALVIGTYIVFDKKEIKNQ